MTERLQSMCRRFDLILLGQHPAQPTDCERDVLPDKPLGGNWVIREVILCGDGQPWVYARSVICQALVDGELSQLGQQPLGKVIFNDKRFSRSEFQLSYALAPDKLAPLIEPKDMYLWGRRSCFHYADHVMLVAETFLPDAPAYRGVKNERMKS